MRQNPLMAAMMVMAGVLLTLTPKVQGIGLPSGDTNEPTYTVLDSWSFADHTNWTSDYGYAPVSFTNLSFCQLGDGASLVVDTNEPAWLQYNIYESDGSTNLTLQQGTLMFWFAPSSWSSTNAGGTGPGEPGRLLEVGAYTTNSSYGLWSIYVDAVGENLYFSAQTNDLSGELTTYVSAPISWTTNYFHFVVLSYSETNTSLYLDGELVTNGPGVTVYPGPNALAGGFYIGSDGTGVYQAAGSFNSVATYAVPMDADTIAALYASEFPVYYINPLDSAMWTRLVSATSSVSSTYSNYDLITGSGSLQWVASVSAISSSNVWITNVLTMADSAGGMAMTFTIQGGYDGLAYDAFVNTVLDFSSNTNRAWGWMGQGYHGNTYQLTNLPSGTCFLILGTPSDSDSDGLTDAYELLVSRTDPYNACTSGDGLSDSDKLLEGLSLFGYHPQWKLDTDTDGLPDAYESAIPGLSSGYAELAPTLPSYNPAPVP